ncbi:MAG: GTP-binding protein [Sulfitobacter sp.]
MKRLPLSVISGYLGAGKTTLINRLLAEDHGLNLMVMVNDFGAINIDEALISRQDKDVIALTNGCVCCTMGADLYIALGDALDRRPRPDHLIIEASGIADPMAIAGAAIAEPEMSYAGIVTLVDGQNITTLLADEMIAPQVLQQIKAADMTVLTKVNAPSDALVAAFEAQGVALPEHLADGSIADLLLNVLPKPRAGTAKGHAVYASWQHQRDDTLSRAALDQKLAARPAHLFRLKGFVRTDGGPVEVHVVGKNVDVIPAEGEQTTTLVGLGLAARITSEEIENWWREG